MDISPDVEGISIYIFLILLAYHLLLDNFAPHIRTVFKTDIAAQSSRDLCTPPRESLAPKTYFKNCRTAKFNADHVPRREPLLPTGRQLYLEGMKTAVGGGNERLPGLRYSARNRNI